MDRSGEETRDHCIEEKHELTNECIKRSLISDSKIQHFVFLLYEASLHKNCRSVGKWKSSLSTRLATFRMTQLICPPFWYASLTSCFDTTCLLILIPSLTILIPFFYSLLNRKSIIFYILSTCPLLGFSLGHYNPTLVIYPHLNFEIFYLLTSHFGFSSIESLRK